MFRSISTIGMRTRFILIGTAVLAPIVLVMLQLAHHERETAMVNAGQRVSLLASLTADRQYQFLQQTRIALNQIANRWQAQGGREACNELLADALVRHPWITGIRISTLDGGGQCADPPEIMEFDIADRSYFKSVVAGNEFAVSESLTSRTADRNSIIGIAVPILDGVRPVGVLVSAIKLEAVAELLPDELKREPGVIVDLIDRSGTLLARHPHLPEVISRPDADGPVVRRALQKPGGLAVLRDVTGGERLFAFDDVDTAGWIVAVGISRNSVVGPIDSALRQRLLLIGAILLSSCLVGLVASEVLVFWPLRALGRTAKALERGDMTARPGLTGLREVGALELTLTRMAEAIQQRENALKDSQAAWEQAVSDTKEANDATSQFLASMSHEIRTPLSGIVGYNDLMLAQKLKPEQRHYAERIEAAAGSVISVIDGILEFARIEAREVEIERRPFALAGLVDNALSMVRASAERKGLSLTVELDPELPKAVVGDESRLRQVLLNLLTNAIKFTSRGGVTLRVHRAKGSGRVRFSIRDTGIGIAETQHNLLFKRFSQAHDTSRRDYGGSGLGLAISKELTELMGGQLGFSSQPARGSTFWIELALPHADASTIELSPAPALTPKAGRILVADDYEMSREITSAMLTLAGHEVDVVDDGAKAVEAVRAKPYDLVLLDIEMGGMNGLVAIRHIRQLPGPARHVPVIAMTANVLPRQVRAFEEAGMDGHLGKPFNRNQLIDKVNLYLSPAQASVVGIARISSRAAAFDKKALNEMKVLLGEQRTAAWVGTLRTQLEAIISVDDKPISRHKLARTAHTLVSQAGSLGFTRLSRLSSELEEACVQHTDYTDSLSSVREACRGALSRIDRIQNGKAGRHMEVNST